MRYRASIGTTSATSKALTRRTVFTRDDWPIRVIEAQMRSLAAHRSLPAAAPVRLVDLTDGQIVALGFVAEGAADFADSRAIRVLCNVGLVEEAEGRVDLTTRGRRLVDGSRTTAAVPARS